jgi:hypothetical protein
MGLPPWESEKELAIVGYKDNNNIKIILIFIHLAHGSYLHMLPIRTLN